MITFCAKKTMVNPIKMSKFTRTWWGNRFIQALEAFTDPNRLERGRAYARNGKIIEYQLKNGKIQAKVRGSVNPYFGVYKEPLYQITIEIAEIGKADWLKIIAHLATKAGFVSRLLINEVPNNIEAAFAAVHLHLLPHSRKDFKTSCSCPDYENPCKHIAGVYYLVAARLDEDPLLLFELRGLARDELQQELRKFPLGQVLSSTLKTEQIPLVPVKSLYTRPKLVLPPAMTEIRDFWVGKKRLPQTVTLPTTVSVPAILIKKGGDYPPFWKKETSFVELMEEFYERVRTKGLK